MSNKGNKPAQANAASAPGTDAEKKLTPRERFEQTGVNRTNSVIKALEILENCADPATYSYTADEWAKIKTAINTSWGTVQKRFDDALAGKPIRRVKQGFSL